MGHETEMTDVQLTYQSLRLSSEMERARGRIAALKADLEHEGDSLRNMERERSLYTAELRSRTAADGQKYHDIGHARTLFESKVVDGKRVPLAAEELNPQVASYLERQKIYAKGVYADGEEE